MDYNMQIDCSVIILAAGYSSRMGSPKFALAINSQSNFLENIIHQYLNIGIRNIIVVLNSEGEKYIEQHPLRISNPIQLIINEHPEYEKFYSLKLGLSALENNGYSFIHPSDLPVVEESTLKEIYGKREEADFVKPVFNKKGGHPILLSPRLIKELVNEKKGDWKLNEFLGEYSSCSVEVDDVGILDNINSREEYLVFLEKIKKENTDDTDFAD
ncbi:NTP transferase domain-containing protein [Lentimicrobium sp. L6]|uniref:nucleotidyltransferase family protein n=1 Tax=Lentimicrobium sp. L6 TaxID=2735916 RepID=UPI001556B7A0|nr:NTP transferase domain-containing protein [Lentimicrobium sp. L6]NPD84590.1 NTP transferase domain-containing protein [Lentimicrobium sp. L6]